MEKIPNGWSPEFYRKVLEQVLQKIAHYRARKEGNIFDDFYHSDLNLMEDLIIARIQRLEIQPNATTVQREGQAQGKSTDWFQ